MSVVNSQPKEEEFIEAEKNWDLEKLYLDLASAKQKALTPVEKKLLRGLLCGCSPAEIAQRVYHSQKSSSVRVCLSNGLYKYIEDILSNQLGYSVKLKNWSHVANFLEKAGYKKHYFPSPQITTLINNTREQQTHVLEVESRQIQDWGEAVDVNGFYGRTRELNRASEWIIQQHCRLIVVLGMAGIGKTVFSIKLAQEIQDQFECVIWRSLHLYSVIDALLINLIQTLSPTVEIDQTATLNTKISQLIDYLRKMRCLLVLDNVDSILFSYDVVNNMTNSNHLSSQIQYRQGYEDYNELITRIGNSQHQSCLLITSREKPPKIAEIEGEKLPVRSLKLTGLNTTESLSILKMKGLAGLDYSESSVLVEVYSGHPLFLKLVATTIHDLFARNIYQFLAQGTLIFGDIRRILDQQFYRLSELEKYMMYWLVLNPDCNSVLSVTSQIIPGWSPQLGKRLILESIELLQRRSLLDLQGANLCPMSIWKHYILERLREKSFQSLAETEISFLKKNPILATQLQKYIQESESDI